MSDSRTDALVAMEAAIRKPLPATETELEDDVAEIRGYRATYLSVVEKARAGTSPFDPRLVIDTLAAFERIEQRLAQATSDEARTSLIEEAEQLEQGRAYIQPGEEILVEARTCRADMSDWGVPSEILQAVEDDLISVMRTSKELPERRAALEKLYQFYDAWSDHTDAYERWATRTAWVLGVLLVGGALGCIASILHRQAIYGFMLAGLTGAIMSVLGKMPPMLGWGQWASYTPRIVGRITTGIATTLTGGALLAIDVIKVGDRSSQELFGPAPETRDMLIVAGLGIVFGFSERAFVTFHQAVFRSDSKPDPNSSS
jgi:hypothetical protein